MKQVKIKEGLPYPLGATVDKHGVNFSMVNSSQKECGVVLYAKKTDEKIVIPFEDKHKTGNISCFYMENIAISQYDYNFFIGEEEIPDRYAKRILGNEEWGKGKEGKLSLKSGFYVSDYDWKKDKRLHIPYSESVFYCLHVRSFTMHASSKVKHKGTFEGIVEKIPYLKELGITAIEMLPCYEFEEFDSGEDKTSISYQVAHYTEVLDSNHGDKKMNYWGFKDAYYFAPKASYSAIGDSVVSFKNMVSQLHANGIEVIMQFYFPQNVKQGYILEVMKHWVMEYHIDGIHVKGAQIPVTLLATEPLFANVKLMCHDFSLSDIYDQDNAPRYKNLGYYRNEYMHDMRCFLKGDSDMLKGFSYHLTNQNPSCGIVNYITNYDGFTLHDLVSYERKHNEANQEKNQDGTDYNYSWNCGVEGPSRKRSVVLLRKQQMKNALVFLFTSQGTPLLLAGDEFANTQKGNNNCYCQDNEMSWLDWNQLKKNKEQFSFVRDLISFRKQHPILHKEEMLTMTDRFGFGYPDLSFHGKQAWKADLENYNRHLAVLYCGMYGKKKDKSDDDYIYLAYNMYWEEIDFALPTLPKDFEWECVFCTREDDMTSMDAEDLSVKVSARSIKVLLGKKKQVK